MKHQGSCHCGKVSFEVELSFDMVISCNCSICSKKGQILTFAPEEKFHLLSGAEDLSVYQFGAKTIEHYFCSHCGVATFGKGIGPDGKKMRAINVRTLEGVELDKLKIQPFDGKSLP